MQPPQFSNARQNSISKITLLLIVMNVGLFAWQIFTGVDISHPTTIDAIRWGADYAPLTYLEEPIRIFTSTFFNFGLVHLMLNMWALYIFGNVAEQILGDLYYLGLYLLAGISGSLLSGYIDIRNSYELIQNFDPDLFPHVSAGASGAVMGIGGALALLSLLPPLAHQTIILDRKSILLILALNIGMGFVISGMSHAAQIGGMIMGALLALTWYLMTKAKIGWVGQLIILIVATLITYFIYHYLMNLVAPIRPLWLEILTQSQKQLGF